MESWIVLIIRHDKMIRRIVPAMKSDDEGEDALAEFPSKLKAMEMCTTHILARTSDCIILNTETLEVEEH